MIDQSKRNKTKKIAQIGVFSALSIILYYIRFPLPIFPPFLQVQFSNLPIIIISLCMGAKTGMLVLLIKTIIGAMFSFGESYAVGELMDLIIGTAVVLTSTLTYNHFKTKKGGALALLTGMFAWVIVAVLANYFIGIRLYLIVFFKNDVSSFVGACSIIPGINESNYLIRYCLYAALPFNLIVSFTVCLVTFIVYKRVSNILKGDEEKFKIE